MKAEGFLEEKSGGGFGTSMKEMKLRTAHKHSGGCHLCGGHDTTGSNLKPTYHRSLRKHGTHSAVPTCDQKDIVHVWLPASHSSITRIGALPALLRAPTPQSITNELSPEERQLSLLGPTPASFASVPSPLELAPSHLPSTQVFLHYMFA